jgi:hypothetical protein
MFILYYIEVVGSGKIIGKHDKSVNRIFKDKVGQLYSILNPICSFPERFLFLLQHVPSIKAVACRHPFP